MVSERTKSDFTLRQLTMFVSAARAASFARAAEELGVTQPAISGCIAILESRLGRRLFNRRPGGTSLLTRDGLELLDMAEKLLDASDAIRADDARGGHRKQRVRLCIGPLLRDLYLKPLLPSLYRDHPEIELELLPIIPLGEVQGELDRGRVDLVVYTIGRPADGWPNTTLVCDVAIVMIGAPGTGARVAAGEISIEDLPFILPGTGRLGERWIERQLAALSIKPRQNIVYLDFPDVIPDMVAQGLGVSVLMREQVEQQLADGRLEIFGPAMPSMRRVITRSMQAGSAARLVEDYLVAAFERASDRASPVPVLSAHEPPGAQPILAGLPFSVACTMPRPPATDAGVAKLVDAPDLGSGIARCGGSSPFARTSCVASRPVRSQEIFSQLWREMRRR